MAFDERALESLIERSQDAQSEAMRHHREVLGDLANVRAARSGEEVDPGERGAGWTRSGGARSAISGSPRAAGPGRCVGRRTGHGAGGAAHGSGGRRHDLDIQIL